MDQRNLLIVDDDKSFLASFQQSFQSNYKVFCASSFSEAFQILNSTQVNVIFLDYNLGNETGHFFLDQLRSRNFEIPVVVLSGCINLEMSLGFLKRRIFDFLEKPISFKDVENVLNQIFQIEQTLSQLQIDYVTRKVTYNNRLINLTPTEFQILKFFISNQGQQLSREEIVNFVWGERQVSKNSFDTHLINLKRKLPIFAQKLTSVYGTGYCYEV